MKRLLASCVLALLPFAVRADEATPALQDNLRTAGVGQILDLDGMKPLALPPLDVNRVYSGGSFIYSGSPEYCPGPGVLYRDTFPAGSDVRLYVYHVNASPAPLRFSVVLEPVDGKPVVTVGKGMVFGPDTDYYTLGRLAAFVFLGRPHPLEPHRIRVNKPVLMDADLDRRVIPSVKPEALIHSLHDLHVEGGTVRVNVVAVEGDADTLARFPSLVLHGRDKHHDRGTFPYARQVITMPKPYSTAEGVVHLRMADGNAEPPAIGGDATTGIRKTYLGGYGVSYTVNLKMKATDGRRVALLLNPRAGGLAGAVTVYTPRHGHTTAYAPVLSQDTVEKNTDAVVLGKWDPAVTPEVTVVWTPPAAASLPVEWLLVPYDAVPPAVAPATPTTDGSPPG